jgi:prophage regulatory protein
MPIAHNERNKMGLPAALEKTDRLLRLDDVLKIVGLGKTKLYALIQEGSFPPGFSIGRARLWRWSVVQDWVRSH